MSEYIRFEDETPPDRKTKVVGVYSISSGDWLGTIKWYGAWRQYTLHTAAGSIWNVGCLAVISSKISDLMKERKARV